jgi:hypothetical protein
MVQFGCWCKVHISGPRLCGFIVITFFVRNVVTDEILVDIAVPMEIAASAISLVWVFIQTTRDNQLS